MPAPGSADGNDARMANGDASTAAAAEAGGMTAANSAIAAVSHGAQRALQVSAVTWSV